MPCRIPAWIEDYHLHPRGRRPKRKLSRLTLLGLICGLFALALFGSVLAVGLFLSLPVQTRVGPPPPALEAETVSVPSKSGATLSGWFSHGQPGGGLVILMHGVRANRWQMAQRALVLHRHGFGVLLFDFQAHGESVGRRITFGHLEARDAAAALDYARRREPGERIGVIGVSLGGAAALLAQSPLDVQALVLESVYPDIVSALADRLRTRLPGMLGMMTVPILVPTFKLIMPPILGVRIDDLRPIDRIGSVTAPLFMAAGTADTYTPMAESRALFLRAPQPKEFWAVEGAGHVDLEQFGPDAYWRHLLPFLASYLKKT
jgi:fermentation-respiration switch protein FrsA (DUF1100 family)